MLIWRTITIEIDVFVAGSVIYCLIYFAYTDKFDTCKCLKKRLKNVRYTYTCRKLVFKFTWLVFIFNIKNKERYAVVQGVNGGKNTCKSDRIKFLSLQSNISNNNV